MAWVSMFQTGLRIRIQLLTLMRIRILIFIKMIGICDYWPIDLPGLHFEPPGLLCERPRLYFEPRKLLNSDFNSDLDPALHSNADPDPQSATPVSNVGCDSGSTQHPSCDVVPVFRWMPPVCECPPGWPLRWAGWGRAGQAARAGGQTAGAATEQGDARKTGV